MGRLRLHLDARQNAVQSVLRERDDSYRRDLRTSPFASLMPGGQVAPRRDGWPHLRRRLSGPDARLDFPILQELGAGGGTDYYAQVLRFGPEATRRAAAVSVALLPAIARRVQRRRSDADPGGAASVVAVHHERRVASYRLGLLAAYLGEDAGRRVHAGAIERGSVESIRAVLCFTDIRGWTSIADAHSGPALIDLLDEVFETIVAPLRSRGGQV